MSGLRGPNGGYKASQDFGAKIFFPGGDSTKVGEPMVSRGFGQGVSPRRNFSPLGSPVKKGGSTRFPLVVNHGFFLPVTKLFHCSPNTQRGENHSLSRGS